MEKEFTVKVRVLTNEAKALEEKDEAYNAQLWEYWDDYHFVANSYSAAMAAYLIHQGEEIAKVVSLLEVREVSNINLTFKDKKITLGVYDWRGHDWNYNWYCVEPDGLVTRGGLKLEDCEPDMLKVIGAWEKIKASLQDEISKAIKHRDYEIEQDKASVMRKSELLKSFKV